MKRIKIIGLFALIVDLTTILVAFGAEKDATKPAMDAFLAPKGGFASINKDRTLVLRNKGQVPATLENAVLDLIQRSDQGTIIRLVMYSFSTKHIRDELIAAGGRGADIKVIMDGVNSFAEPARKEFLAKLKEQNSAIQVKTVTAARMKELGRVYRHADGQEFIGSMHEKFGVFMTPGAPAEIFIGSANISYSSDSMFAENRITAVADDYLRDALLKEFDILWKEYGLCATEPCNDEPPRTYKSGEQLRLVTNSEISPPRTGMSEAVIELIRTAKGGSLDIAMFYFTRRVIAEAILDVARSSPETKIRLLMDQEQLDQEQDTEVLSEWLDEIIAKENLTNFTIHVRWTPKAYGWDTDQKPPRIAKVFKLAPFLMHHKFFIVNGDTLVNGSFNWTDLGEQNLENLLIIPALDDKTRNVVARFKAEFEELWENQSISTIQARAEKAKIYQQLASNPIKE